VGQDPRPPAPGDFILLQFGHNDSSNHRNYPDRTHNHGIGDEIIHIGIGVSNKSSTRTVVPPRVRQGRQGQGATIIICSPVPRNVFIKGKINRGFGRLRQWAADAAKASALSSSTQQHRRHHYDALARRKTANCSRTTSTPKKAGARLNAESVIEASSN